MMGRQIWRAGLSFLIALAAGCAAQEPEPRANDDATASSTAQPGTGDAGEFFATLEGDLLRRTDTRIGYRITSEGAFPAGLEGGLSLSGDGGASLSSRGTFGDDSVALSLATADGRLVGGSGDRAFDEPIPPGLREALVIGLTRMGLLHNLARLVAGAPPDRADGTVRTWVEARDVAWTTRDDLPGTHGLAFAIWVAGQHTADAVLWLDAAGRPVARDQTVRFPGGEMRVREEYEFR